MRWRSVPEVDEVDTPPPAGVAIAAFRPRSLRRLVKIGSGHPGLGGGLANKRGVQ